MSSFLLTNCPFYQQIKLLILCTFTAAIGGNQSQTPSRVRLLIGSQQKSCTKKVAQKKVARKKVAAKSCAEKSCTEKSCSKKLRRKKLHRKDAKRFSSFQTVAQ